MHRAMLFCFLVSSFLSRTSAYENDFFQIMRQSVLDLKRQRGVQGGALAFSFPRHDL